MKALILVDLQREFLPEGGWELPDSESVVALANRLQRRFRVVVATQDWHLRSHKIFASNHDKREIGQVIDFKKQVFTLTRDHCVQKTHGSELAPALQRDSIHRVFQRGMDSDLNGYSAFFENDHRTSTGLTEFLRVRKVTEVYILGFSPDGCVLHTALDAQALGFKTFLIQDAVRTAPQTEAEKAADLQLLKEAGVLLVRGADMI
ncbi:MAG: isochorismatase family protein [Verrucomicrobiales bacterium]|nr:isochorismatase family protein [Verrucomicrobiales bacterium]